MQGRVYGDFMRPEDLCYRQMRTPRNYNPSEIEVLTDTVENKKGDVEFKNP